MVYTLDEIYINLITAIRSCQEFPQNVTVHIGETDSRQSAMSIVVDLNLSKTKKTVCGELIKVYDFDLYYQISTQTDNQKVNTLKFLNKLSNFLCSNYYKFNLYNITIMSSPKIMGKNNNGLDIYLTKFLIG